MLSWKIIFIKPKALPQLYSSALYIVLSYYAGRVPAFVHIWITFQCCYIAEIPLIYMHTTHSAWRIAFRQLPKYMLTLGRPSTVESILNSLLGCQRIQSHISSIGVCTRAMEIQLGESGECPTEITIILHRHVLEVYVACVLSEWIGHDVQCS